MTNVHSIRRRFDSAVLLALSLTVIAMTAAVPAAHAQDLFSSSGGNNNSGASEVIDVNRRSFGMNFRFGHDAGDTVGRQDSLTHMSLAPYFNTGPALVFADARLGRANKGGLTWAFGTGLRTFVEEWDVVTGANFYHSRDNITGALLQTWGMGVEVLSEDWEVRANYVEPRGTTSVLTNQAIDQASAEYAGNNIIFDRIDTVAEALEKIDVEAGVKLPSGPLENVKLRGFIGAYRFQGETVSQNTGWKTRLQANVGEYLELGGGLNQDSLTETTVFFNAIVSFGGFKSQDYTKNSAIHRLADPVRRDITVSSLRTNVVVPGQVAIDPTDGLPLQVVHVDSDDNVGPFLGTVENPLMSLNTALGVPGADVVFVHAGGLYNAAPDNMAVLANGQDLFGEGLIPATSGDRFAENTVLIADLGELTLPDSPKFTASGKTLLRPTMQGAVGDAVTLAEDSRFGGMIIDGSTGAGIFSNNVGGTIINDVLVQNTLGDGILLFDTTGTTTIINTVVSNTIGAAFHVDGGVGSIGYQSESVGLIPAWSNIENSTQQAVLIENMTGGVVNTTGITINDNGGTGVSVLNNNSSVIIDNAQLMDSTGNGISIVNSGGTITFRSTLQGTTLISNAAMPSVFIDNLAANGQVTFNSLQIDGRNDTGITINASAGRVDFLEGVLIGAPNSGTAAGVSVTGALADSVIDFASVLTITGSGGRGIEVTGSDATSVFRVQEQVGISGATQEAISIINESGVLDFQSGVVIESRNERGVSIQSSTGIIDFGGFTTIGNDLNALFAAVDIQNSEADVTFANLNATNVRAPVGTGAGINLLNNLAGATNNAVLTFGEITIEGTADATTGVGVLGLNNTDIRINDGTIAITNDAAIDLEESGWDVALEMVTSTMSIDNGIRLVNAAPPEDNTFEVNQIAEIAGPGTGGAITSSAGPAVLLANAGQVALRGMQFEDNASDFLVTNSGLDEDDDQFVVIEFSSFIGTLGRIIDAQNVTTFVLDDSIIDDEGAGIGPNTINLTYTERTNDEDTTQFGQFDNPYEVFIRRNVISDTFDNVIVITGEAGAEDAHLDVLAANNLITLDLGLGGQDETAITVDWTGPSRINLASNDTTLNGDDLAGNKMGFNVIHRSTTDEMLLSVVNNAFTATDDGSVGLTIRTFGESDIVVDSNAFTFGGEDATGMLFNLASDTDFFLENNAMRFDADGGSGVIFSLVNQPSTFVINNNQIGLNDDGPLIESGIRFLAGIGTSNLVGNENNLVFLLNPDDPTAFIEIPSSFGGLFNGTILINGVAQP